MNMVEPRLGEGVTGQWRGHRGGPPAAVCALLAMAFMPVLAMGQAADPFYIAVDLGVPQGGTNSNALAVNADGTVVVGQARVGTKNLPFVWRNGQMEIIGDSASMTSGTARGVTGTLDDFRVVGEYTNAGLRHGFVYSSDGTFQDLPMIAGHEQSSAWSINADGKIAGYTFHDLGSAFVSFLRKQAVPVRWDPASPSPGVAYSQPTILFSGPFQNYSVAQCAYSGRGFNIGNPIRLNDAAVPVVVASWNVPTTNCFSQGTNINVLNYIAARPIKHSTADTDIGLSSWKLPSLPAFSAYAGYYPNQNNREYANTYGVAVNNIGTELHNEDAPLFQPGLTSRAITGYTWKEAGGTSTYTAAAGVQACNIARTLRYADVNDSDDVVGYTNVNGSGTPCVQVPRGFVQHLLGSSLATRRYLDQKVSSTCGWTRLVPTDITNDGHIVGGGLRSGAAGGHAFLLVPVGSLPEDPTEACTAPETPEAENEPPVADAGPDQTLEASSPEGAAVTLDGSASSDPEGDPLAYGWNTPVGEATGETTSVTLPIGMHLVTLTVTDDKDASDTDTVTVTVEDTTPPDTVITLAPPALANSSTATFEFEGADLATAPDALTFECAIDGAWAGCTSPASYPGLADGAHQFAVRAVDGVGTADATPATHQWTVDATPPTITITSPAEGARFLIGATAAASYTCSDAGSGVASCVGTLANGTPIDTYTPGSFAFDVDAEDLAGNTATQGNRYTIGYGTCNHQEFAARRAGSVIPVKLQACDVAGVNLSRPTLIVTAFNIQKVSDSTTSPVIDAGHANPDLNFRFDPTLFGGAGGYLFNMDTSGLTTGTYLLQFKIGSDPELLSVPFELR